MNEKAKQVIELLGLEPLPVEGGYFKLNYRSEEILPPALLPGRYQEQHCFGSAIYYLLTPDTFSALHRLPTDEIFHFYLGDPVEMLQLFEDGTGKVIRIGNDIENGLFPQVLAPRHVWQGTRLIDGGEFALMGTTMAPGFEYADYESADKQKLLHTFPAFGDMIEKLVNKKS